jgi:hypothetical protein
MSAASKSKDTVICFESLSAAIVIMATVARPKGESIRMAWAMCVSLACVV